MTQPTVKTACSSIHKILRHVEWVFLGILVLRATFPILYKPLGYEISSGDYVVLCVLILFFILSFQLPIDRPLWQKRAYLWIEIIALLATRLFSEWGLDIFLWFVLVKSCFLLSRREVIFTAIASGTVWQIALAKFAFTYLDRPIEEAQADVTAMYEIPQSIQVFDYVLNSTAAFIAVNSLIIFLCLTIISERKSRQREAALAQEVELLAADLERARIARDIHDSLGHTLTSLDIQLELAQRLYERNSTGARQAIDISKLLSGQSLQEVRRAVTTLREEAFDLNAAIANLVEPLKSDSNLVVENKLTLPKLPLQTSHQLYCIIKEGLENIRRHAQARVIGLYSWATPENIVVYIEDDGVGFDVGLSATESGSRFGLRGMQERSQSIGGCMKIDSASKQGTRIQITVPYDQTLTR
ncbi:Histidine kinase domain protein [Synechococcus sp. PCC 7335]|uniref:sensor histidine kinase n=1 Tax=Synechococcus sp. (strain ATCC 29403 / PCC 7335) TaxID=91464 RepID=UPI00017EE81F|nr:sensor histidine kinase [Synechococcus sp. PCC 7335]EDX82839.1 Histidine kinase domain protein [Synechococcus sp. PCC 7335]